MIGFELGLGVLLLAAGGIGFAVYEFLRRHYSAAKNPSWSQGGREGEAGNVSRLGRLDRTGSAQARANLGVSHEKQGAAKRPARGLQNTQLYASVVNVAQRIERVLPMTRADGDTYRLLLARAGWRIEPETLRGVRVLVALGCALLLGVAVVARAAFDFLPACCFVLACAVAGWMIPRLVVERAIVRRRGALERQLPDAIELLGIAIAAGSPVEQCFREVAQNLDQPLSGEFDAVNREVNLLGHSREQAFSNLAQRCESRDIAAFVAQFSQAVSQGSSIVEGLSAQAALARETAQAARLERIRKMSTKLDLVLSFCFLPPTIALVVLPTVVNLLKFLNDTLK